MKKMKLFLPLLLACAVLFSACGQEAPAETAPETEAVVTEASEETEPETEEETTVEETEPETEEETEAEPEIYVQAAEEIDFDEEAVLANAPGRLHVSGTKLVDAEENVVQLKGISTHGIQWFPQYVNETLFSEFKNDWNLDIVRLAMYTYEDDGYCNGGDQELIKRYVKNGVRFATENGMYVIVDWHILYDRDPNVYKDEALAFFDEMSREFKDYPNVIYELCNEPNRGTEWAAVKSYAEEVIPVIRANAPEAICIVGTPAYCQSFKDAIKDPLTQFDNVMYTLHFYAGNHGLRSRNAATEAMENGLPLFITEYGICSGSGDGNLDYHSAEQWMEYIDENQLSCCLWNLSNKNESSSVLKADCEKTSGFTADDLNDHGKWLYLMVNGVEME